MRKQIKRSDLTANEKLGLGDRREIGVADVFFAEGERRAMASRASGELI